MEFKGHGPLVALFLGVPTPCDDCIDSWETTYWEWLHDLSGKNYYGGDWFDFATLSGGDDWELKITGNYLFSKKLWK